LRPCLVRIGVSFEDSFDVLLLVSPFSKTRANLKGITWCNFDSFGVTWSLVAMISDSG
jgi:hypothetical protein